MALSKFNFNSFDVTTAASAGLGFNASANGFSTISPGAMTLIKTLTASSSANLSFVDGSSDVVLDSTYPIYLFKFISIHPANNDAILQFNLSTDSGSNYNVAKTSTYFRALHNEGGSSTNLVYQTSHDLAQGTGMQDLAQGIGNDNDQCTVGTLHLFNPSSTTFVKNFTSRFNTYEGSDFSIDQYCGGYGNTASAIDAVKFAMSSGNIDAGTIKLYGIKDS